MAVAAVMSRRAASKQEPDIYPQAVALPHFVSVKTLERPASGTVRPTSPKSNGEAGGDEDNVSKAISFYSKKEVNEDEFQEILEEQGVADVESNEEEVEKPKFADSMEFESGIGCLIALNALMMGFEVDLANQGDVGWIVLENFFCVLWIVEMLLKLHSIRLMYFYQPWNILDFFLVLLSVAEAWVIPALSITGVSALGSLRMVRVLRILRLLRLIRLVKLFKNLWLIIVGFRESLSTLFWVLMLLSVVIYVFAIFLRYTLNCQDQFRDWADCSEYFGSMPAAMYSLFQVITLESWSQVFARPILRVQPGFFVVFLLFLFLTTFGILNIIVGVIVENTLNAAKQNQELQERRMQRQLRQELESIRRLFEEADADGSGTLEQAEFVAILSDGVVQQTLTRMEIPIEDPGTLFAILDPQNSGSLSFPTFAQGVLKIKGPPTQLDMKTMQLGVASISRRVAKVEHVMEKQTEMIAANMEMLSLLLEKLGHKPPDSRISKELPGRISKELPGRISKEPPGRSSKEPPDRISKEPPDRSSKEPPERSRSRIERMASHETDMQDPIEVESIGGEDKDEVHKAFSNSSCEMLRETSNSFRPAPQPSAHKAPPVPGFCSQ
ncbi:unnamed protein product [Effrenium voratum]|nr:unnamed protein product [Effrenium voratum]